MSKLSRIPQKKHLLGLAEKKSNSPMNTPEEKLRERVKELICLYGVTSVIVGANYQDLQPTFDKIVACMEKAYQFVEDTYVEMATPEGISRTKGYQNQPLVCLESPILVFEKPFGKISVGYPEDKYQLSDFLEEEKTLLSSICLAVGNLLERKQIHLEQEATRKQMERADRLFILGEITAGIAHELNTPLANILGFAELLQETIKDPSALRDLKKIQDHAIFSREIVKKLMFFACEMPGEMQKIELKGLVENVVKLLKPSLKEKNITLISEFSDETIYLKADNVQLTQVFFNLIMNAIYASKPNSIIKLVLTGYPSASGVLEVIQSGAIDYLTKPFTREELKGGIEKAFAHKEKLLGKDQTVILSKTDKKPNQPSLYGEMVGNSPSFKKMANIIERVKDNKATVLIGGESGTGKELVARAIHYSGKFARAPFVAVNCGAIPENLQEAELFGYLKGAFTGANENRSGFFQAAQGGTLFLDEIGTATLAVQTKLLRALQEKEITKVGSQKAEKMDIRIVAATNVHLGEEIKNKTFREDLYYRLSVVEIAVPPLRERKEDIPVLVEKFLRKYGVEYKDRLLGITDEALQILGRYSFPGNIRELENIIQRAVILCDGKIGTEDLPDYLKYQIDFPQTELLPLAQMEKKYIEQVLVKTAGNKSKAAEILQIDRKTLREKLK
ncbi:MAG: hypothetical protein C4K58_05595 [Flavobacteriaceae bacterium]|nr:MAG: hypothetical protein C4K58_05595 [Flavobacteriaceae bacterium]